MPTAQKFYASGVGNGFPFCLDKVDVSGYDYWITLGGTSKANLGSLTPAEQAENAGVSAMNAKRLFYDLYEVNSRVKDSSNGSFIDLNANVIDQNSTDNVDLATFNYVGARVAGNYYVGDADALAEPKNKLKKVSQNDDTLTTNPAWVEADDDVHGVQSGNWNRTDVVDTSWVGSSLVPLFPGDSPIIRMYNGATSSEANFVGYGVNSTYLTSSVISVDIVFTPLQSCANIFAPPIAVYLCSYGDDFDVGVSNGAVGYTQLTVVGETNTIPFVCATYQDYTTGSDIADPTNRQAGWYDGTDYSFCSIDSIEFYTTA